MLTILLILLLLFMLLGAPVFAVILGGTILGCLAEPRPLLQELSGPITTLFSLSSNDEASSLSTIPLFIFAGYLMAEAKTADRLVRFANALIGWLPGGLAIVTVFACAVFTIFSGASGVTIVALGGLVMPSLIKQGYPQRFSLGLVTGTGSIGLLFFPALPLFVYGTIYGLVDSAMRDRGGGEMELGTFDTGSFLFAGIVPGLVLCGLICLYASAVAVARKVPRQKFNWSELLASAPAVLPELLIPFVMLGALGTGSGIPEAAAITALYVLIVELVIFRDISLRSLYRLTRESMALVGALFIIILCARALSQYLVNAGVAEALFEWMQAHVHSKWVFLLALNILLLLVGMLMDIFSAIVVVVPLIAPTAVLHFGIDPYHLGVIFLLNLELGYLTPPVGLNLFIASFKFDAPILSVVRASAPFLLIMIVALGLVTYVPALTVVPEPERRGRVGTLVKMVEKAHKAQSLIEEIPMPEGRKPLKLSDCAAIADSLNRTECEAVFRAYTGCKDDPCRAKVVSDYIEKLDDQATDDDDFSLD